MRFLWLQALAAKKSEIKLAGITASLASLLVIIVILWSANLFTDKEEISIAQPEPVRIVEKPTIITSLPANNYSTTPAQNMPSANPALANVAKNTHSAVTTAKKHTIVIGRGHFYIQVGAYQQQKLARLMFKKMKHKYKRAKIIAKGNMHAVWVGPVATRGEVILLKKRLQRLDNIKGFVITP